METMTDTPQHWNDFDMNWKDPDPLRSCYYSAIREAINEKMNALNISGERWNFDDFYFKNKADIPSVAMLKRLAMHIVNMLKYNGSYILIKNKFLDDDSPFSTPLPSHADLFNHALTFPVPGQGQPLVYAKDFLIWAKKMLDTMTMFAYPYIKINYYNPEKWDSIEDSFVDDPQLQGVTDEKTRAEITASLFCNMYSEHILIKNTTTQNFDIWMQTYFNSIDAGAKVTVKLPESIVVRSFARPHIYCMIKPMPLTAPEQANYFFSNFGYDFEKDTNIILDLGQLPEEKDKKIELFQFQLNQLKEDLCAGDRIHHEFKARCYFALDYNVEGGFKFRPEI